MSYKIIPNRTKTYKGGSLDNRKHLKTKHANISNEHKIQEETTSEVVKVEIPQQDEWDNWFPWES